MNFLRDLFGKKESTTKIKKPAKAAKLPKPRPMGPEELETFVVELLEIDRTDGLMQATSDSNGQLVHRHDRGREIGQILCYRGSNDLMLRAAKMYVGRGGDEWNLSHCWHEVEDQEGVVCWWA